MPGNSDPKALRVAAQPSVLTVLEGVLWGEAPGLGGELTISLAEMVVIGRVGQGDSQDGVVADGHGDIALLAGPVDVMLVGGQVLGQPGRVAHGGPHQAGASQAFDESVPVHLAVAEANLQKPGRDAVGGQQQGIGQFVGGAGHVTSDEAGAEPVGGAIGRDDLAELEPGELARGSPKAVEAIAAVEASGEQLRGLVEPSCEVRPDALGVMPDLVVERACHGYNDLLGAARRLRRGGFSLTIDWPGVRSRVHLGILLCGNKKDDEKAVGRTPGTSIPAIR